jgi:hypothetical protein
MAKVRSAFAEPAVTPVTTPVVAAPWPFETKEAQAELPLAPEAPAVVIPVTAPAYVSDSMPVEKKTRAPRSDAGVPRVPKVAAPAAAVSIIDLVIRDMLDAVQTFKDAEPRRRLSALDEIELRAKVVRQIIG